MTSHRRRDDPLGTRDLTDEEKCDPACVVLPGYWVAAEGVEARIGLTPYMLARDITNAAGISQAELARQFGISYRRVRKIMTGSLGGILDRVDRVRSIIRRNVGTSVRLIRGYRVVTKRVTQADVARRAGVSQTAVSQILGTNRDDAAKFRPDTRQRVLRAAEELGYVLSMTARALRLNRTMTIGVVVGFITDELSLRITRGIQSVAYERGYTLLIGDTEQDPQLELRVLEQFRQHQVDGLIFVDTWRDPDMFLTLGQDQYPSMVFANLRQAVTSHNCVGVDNVQGGYEATRHLLDLGRRKIAHISGPEYWQSSLERVQGYRQALDEYGLQYEASLLEVGDWEVAGGAAALDRLLDGQFGIDAVFVSNDLMAAGCIQAATRRHLRIPDDLALVSYDDRRLAEALNPPLTSFALPLNLIGQKAAHLLIERLLQDDSYLVPSVRVPGGLAIRASCGASRRA